MNHTSADRVLTKYGEGIVSNDNDTHFWVMLDRPLKFSDQYLNSIPIKKSEVTILSSNSYGNCVESEETIYAGEI